MHAYASHAHTEPVRAIMAGVTYSGFAHTGPHTHNMFAHMQLTCWAVDNTGLSLLHNFTWRIVGYAALSWPCGWFKMLLYCLTICMRHRSRCRCQTAPPCPCRPTAGGHPAATLPRGPEQHSLHTVCCSFSHECMPRPCVLLCACVHAQANMRACCSGSTDQAMEKACASIGVSIGYT